MFNKLIQVDEKDKTNRDKLKTEVVAIADVEQFFYHHKQGVYNTTNTNYEQWTAEDDTESRVVFHEFIRGSFEALFSTGIMGAWKKLYSGQDSGFGETTKTYETEGWRATRLTHPKSRGRSQPTTKLFFDGNPIHDLRPIRGHKPIASFLIQRDKQIDGYDQSMLLEISAKDITTTIQHKRLISDLKIVTHMAYRNGFSLMKLPTHEEFMCVVQKTTTITNEAPGCHTMCKGWGVNSVLLDFFTKHEIVRTLFSAFVVDTIVNAGTIAFLNNNMKAYPQTTPNTLTVGEWYWMDKVYKTFNTFFRINVGASTNVPADATVDYMQEKAIDCVNTGQDIIILKDSWSRETTEEKSQSTTKSKSHTVLAIAWGKNAIFFFEKPTSLFCASNLCVEIADKNESKNASKKVSKKASKKVDDGDIARWLMEPSIDDVKTMVTARILDDCNQATTGHSIYPLNNELIHSVCLVGDVIEDGNERVDVFRDAIQSSAGSHDNAETGAGGKSVDVEPVVQRKRNQKKEDKTAEVSVAPKKRVKRVRAGGLETIMQAIQRLEFNI